VPPRRRSEVDVLPIREELDALAHGYQHLRTELKNEGPESSTRRRLGNEEKRVRDRFERLLEEWVPDDELRDAWRTHLESHGPAPAEPEAIRPRAFMGVHETSGSVVEVRGRGDDEYEVWVDGSLVERVAAQKDFGSDHRARFRFDDMEFYETFAASTEALQALADFLAGEGQRPPWEYASELLADGLIDTHFALTARGRRALARLR
jgi:hypothetical protein